MDFNLETSDVERLEWVIDVLDVLHEIEDSMDIRFEGDDAFVVFSDDKDIAVRFISLTEDPELLLNEQKVEVTASQIEVVRDGETTHYPINQIVDITISGYEIETTD